MKEIAVTILHLLPTQQIPTALGQSMGVGVGEGREST